MARKVTKCALDASAAVKSNTGPVPHWACLPLDLKTSGGLPDWYRRFKVSEVSKTSRVSQGQDNTLNEPSLCFCGCGAGFLEPCRGHRQITGARHRVADQFLPLWVAGAFRGVGDSDSLAPLNRCGDARGGLQGTLLGGFAQRGDALQCRGT